MEGSVEKLVCDARVHGWIVDERYIRIRCRDRRCPDVIRAKPKNQLVIHVWDMETKMTWTEYLTEGDH